MKKIILKELILILFLEAFVFYIILLCCELNNDFSRLWELFAYTQIGVVLNSLFGLIFLIIFKENENDNN